MREREGERASEREWACLCVHKQEGGVTTVGKQKKNKP